MKAAQPTPNVMKTWEGVKSNVLPLVLSMLTSLPFLTGSNTIKIVATVKLIEILPMKMIGNHLINSPHLENEYDGVVTELLDKCGLMRSSYSLSLRINKVLQVKMIEAEKSVKRILTL